MHALVLLLAASVPHDGRDAPVPAAIGEPASACVAQRLKPFVSPYGIQQAWPVMASPPADVLDSLGAPLADMGQVADGYQQFVHVDTRARAVYVVEQGGFAGTTKVFGPLPLPRCAPDTPPASTTPR